jgi:hypothetical protein
MGKDPPDFDDLFEPFELDDGPPPPSDRPEPRPEAPASSAQSTVGDAATVACPSCGSANAAHNRHCEQCGARLSQEPLPVAPPPTLRTSPGGRAIGVLAAVTLLVALAALAFNIFGGDDTAAPTSTTAPTSTIPPAARELFAASVEASSFLPGWEPENLIDGDPSTHWNDESLHGIGAWLTFRFSEPVSITEIELQNLVDDEKFKRNYKVQGYLITTDDLTVEFSGRLDNVNAPQRVPIASLATRELTVQVASTYPAESAGDKPPFDELALLSIRFFGNDA